MDRDTYQIVLQLKDELSAGLKDIKGKLDQTRIAGKQTTDSVDSFARQARSATQPIREFSKAISMIMGGAGVAMLVRRIAGEIGEMEKAYAKLYPESQKAAGSLKNWNAAILEMKAKAGATIAESLNPIRSFFINLLDPVGQAVRDIKDFNTEMKTLVEKYTVGARLVTEQIAAAQEKLAIATAQNTAALAREAELQKTLALLRATKPVEKVSTAGKASDVARLRTETLMWENDLANVKKELAETLVTIKTTADLMERQPEYVKSLGDKLTPVKDKAIQIAGYAEVSSYWYESATEHIKTENRLLAEQLVTWERIAREIDESIIPLSRGMGPEKAAPESGAQWSGYRDWGSAAFSEMRDVALKKEADAVAELEKEYAALAEQLANQAFVGFFEAIGDAITGTQSLAQAMQNLVASILATIGPLFIQAGLKQLLAGNVPLGLALLTLGGVAIIGGKIAGAQTTAPAPNGASTLPWMASGGIVTRPTLAMIGEGGPEAVIPLGRGMGGGTTIIVQGSIWAAKDLARELAGIQGRW
jgi:hypothetical protein